MTKITKTTKGNTTTYFYDGVKKYEHYKNSNGYEWWSEYDNNRNEIYFKDSDGFEWRSEEVAVTEEEVKPFEFIT